MRARERVFVWSRSANAYTVSDTSFGGGGGCGVGKRDGGWKGAQWKDVSLFVTHVLMLFFVYLAFCFRKHWAVGPEDERDRGKGEESHLKKHGLHPWTAASEALAKAKDGPAAGAGGRAPDSRRACGRWRPACPGRLARIASGGRQPLPPPRLAGTCRAHAHPGTAPARGCIPVSGWGEGRTGGRVAGLRLL